MGLYPFSARRFSIFTSCLLLTLLLGLPGTRGTHGTHGTHGTLEPEATLEYSEGLFWWVHLSDVHVSVWVPQRTTDLETHFVEALRAIRPPLLVITGDLVEAKNKWKTRTSQNESEWMIYASAVEKMRRYCQNASSPENATEAPMTDCHLSIMDLRGNHDAFEVPMRGKAGDFYPGYSVSKKNEAVRWLAVSPSDKASSLASLAFITVDIAPRVGLRGPANFFAHPTDEDLTQLQGLVGGFQAKEVGPGSPGWLTVALGHYPLAFVARTPEGVWLEDVLMDLGVEAYLPGHLHYKFGTRMYRWHGTQGGMAAGARGQGALRAAVVNTPTVGRSGAGPGAKGDELAEPVGTTETWGGMGRGFWELGNGDWREDRVMRVMAVDNGRISFNEFHLLVEAEGKGRKGQKQRKERLGSEWKSVFADGSPVVLITHPQDARFKPRTGDMGVVAPYIRALVFSTANLAKVRAVLTQVSITQGPTKRAQLATAAATSVTVGVVKLSRMAWRLPGQHVASVEGSPVYQGTWNVSAFAGAPPGEYWMHLEVVWGENRTHTSSKIPFALGRCYDPLGPCQQGGQGPEAEQQWVELNQTWVERAILGVQWEELWPLVRWLPVAGIWVVLLLFKAWWLVLVGGAAEHQQQLACAFRATRLLPYEAQRSSQALSNTGVHNLVGYILPFMRRLALLPVHALEYVAFSYLAFAGETSWLVTMLYTCYLSVGPWFWGSALGDNCPLGRMSLSGWTLPRCVRTSAGDVSTWSGAGTELFSGLAVPDIVTSVVPVLYFAFLPALAWLPLVLGQGPFWSTRRRLRLASKSEAVTARTVNCDADEAGAALLGSSAGGATRRSPSRSEIVEDGQPNRGVHVQMSDASTLLSSSEGLSQSGCNPFSWSWCFRGPCLLKAFLWLCLSFPATVYIHQCKAMCWAYGAMAVILSPGLSWFPAFIGLAMLTSRGFSLRSPCKED